MAKLAPQKITDTQKAMLENLAAKSGESIATVVRSILEREIDRRSEWGETFTEAKSEA